LEREADAIAARVAAGQPVHDHARRYEGPLAGKSAAFGRAPSMPARHRGPWGKAPSTHGHATGGTVFRKGTQITSLTITPPEITADGKATAKATATTNPAGKAVEWSFDGPTFGSTIDKATGAIVAGASIAPEPKSTQVWVKAKADTATKKAPLTLWDEKYKKALDDYPKFIAGTYALPNFKPGVNGNFDALYTPAVKELKATMRLKFDYTNDKSTGVEKMVEGLRRVFSDEWADKYAAAHGMWTVKAKADFERDFQAHIMKQWSDRYTFTNVREPKDVWSKLGPVHVKLDLKTVPSGEHFTVTAHKGPGRAEVVRPNMKLYEGDLTPSAQFANTGADELGRLNAIMPKQVLFDFDKSTVKAADAAQLEYTATYLRRATQPKFIIDLVGHASNPGADKYNQRLSERRAEAVKAFFVTGGASAHHQVNATGVGETGATKDQLWQKVDLTAAVDPAFVNKLDTAGHEFGHMLGVGDEYGKKGDKASHWDLVKKAFGQKYADDVALKDVPGGGSIMRGGEEVRIYHYVTFWEALCRATLKAALPDPKFGFDDWKFNE
ncbi:MAG: OmpA family protein, partial [Deltaproteobacteria bacterium]|nr:OmpA family protein [Kofleriaceae bacterium]